MNNLQQAELAAQIEDRFANLETMITYQEQQIDTLVKNYEEQQKQLFSMEKELNQLRDIARSLQSSVVKNSSDEAPPPHY